MQLKKLSHSHGIAGTSASAAAAASKVNESSELSTSVQRPPYPSPPPAPQRVPHPPARTSNQNLTKTRFFSGTMPSTPNSTPFSTPFLKRRQFKDGKLNSFLAQHNQIYSLDDDPLIFAPTKCRRPRKRLVLHNKAPMWNEASQGTIL